MIPAEAVEAAAKILALTGHSYLLDDWDMLAVTDDPEDDWRTTFREDARRILEAAAPHMLAGAWDDAYMLGFADCKVGAAPTRKNPHKSVAESNREHLEKFREWEPGDPIE